MSRKPHLNESGPKNRITKKYLNESYYPYQQCAPSFSVAQLKELYG